MNKLTERLVIGAAALLIGLLIGWAVRGVTTYNANTESVTTYEDWRMACPPAAVKDQKCQVVEEVVDSQSKTAVVRVALTTNKDNKPELQMILPLGVLLEPGTGLTIGTDPVKLIPYRTCNTVGCVATLVMDDKLLASFGSAKEAKVLIAGLDGKPVAIPLSLKGYGNAMSAYKRAEAKRNSWFWRTLS